ncbi:MAG TPA: hypothetical protein VMU34_07710 [Mycobacterium sp.]|nr:hypothetical protein [Mycobacterium sp.]
MNEYDGRQFIGIDLHRQRSVIVRESESGEQLSAVRIVNDPVALQLQLEEAGADPGLPRVSRIADFASIYAASCEFRYSVRTSCGVR